MTDKEKAQAYDEALEDMRVIYPNLRGDAKLAVEHAFPQLAKSEDEMIREAIIGIIKNSNIIDINVSEEKMIAYLEKQKEQKPAWSEEDEEMLKDIIAEIEATKQYFFSHDSEGGAQMQARIEWLKSLRPSWKPSEEQMESFKKYIEEFQARAEAAVGGWNNFDVMIELYEQLKKLM